MEEKIKMMDNEKFKEINKDEELRNAVAFAHSCYDDKDNFLHKKALMYPISYKVTQEQIKKAKELRDKKQIEVLRENKNNLLFVGMGTEFQPTIKGGLSNHRIRTRFLNSDGIDCFIEVGTGREDNLRIDHALFNPNNETDENKYNNHNLLETKTPALKYTYENVLKLVNQNFNCKFKKLIVDNYNISCDGVICESPKEEVSLLNAISTGDNKTINDLEQRANKGETIRLI